MLHIVLLTLMTRRACRASTPRLLSQASGTGTEAPPEQTVLKIRDAGHRFEVGELYDARIGERVSGRLWSAELLQNHTYETNAMWSYTDVAHSDSIREKRRLMGVSAEFALQVNLGIGSFELQTSASYLLDQRRTTKSVRMATSFQTRTVKEKLDIFDDVMLGNMNGYVLGNHPQCEESVSSKEACQKATHVVTSITWGADVFVVFENAYSDEYERKRLQLYLQSKLQIPFALSVDLETEFLSDESEYRKLNRTRVTTFGDVSFQRSLPTHIDEALDFIKSLPESTGTIVGKGVPMEIELTPLAWLHHDAARLMQQINKDTIERLTDIYEDFDTSEARISDMVNTAYAGFISWKASADAYYNGFRIFRSNYTSALADGMRQFQGGLVDQAVMKKLEDEYLKSEYTAPLVLAEVEARLDTLTNLLSSVATLESAGVIFADSLSGFFGPTFDSRFDRVYGLILVGPSPASNRKGITYIREFGHLAKARLIKNAVPEHPDVVKHCVETIDVGRNETTAKCKERIAFVAIDFESFCTAFCPPSFCQLDPTAQRVCPASENSTPPCELNAEDAQALRCDVNDYVGKCGEDSFHDISNYNMNPTSHCWCACPQTMILQWYHSQPAQGLREELPRVPKPPKLREPAVVGHNESELLPNRQVIHVRLDTSYDDGAYNYRVIYSWKEQIEEGALKTFVDKQRTEETPGRRSVIPLRGLTAGQEYRIEVISVNSEGAGEPVEVPGWWKVAHRMAAIQFPTNNQYEHPHNTGPRWFDVRAQIQLSAQAYDEIGFVSIHTTNELCENVDVKTFDESQENLTLTVLDCTGASSISIVCVLPFSKLQAHGAGEGLELRVWDVSQILTAISPISLVDPSSEACNRYGSQNLFCPESGVCVGSCSECTVDAIPVGSLCKNVKCGDGQLWCPGSQSCINRTTASPGDACMKWCLDADGTGASLATVEGVETCVSSCNLTLPDGYPQGMVPRGETREIDCVEPYYRTHGFPVLFTCPLEGMTKGDVAFHYDAELVMRHSNGTILPSCGKCNDDQVYDRTDRQCRFLRSTGRNYVWNGDVEEYDSQGMPASFTVTGSGVSKKDGGANGLGHALQLQPSTGEQVLVSQKLSLNPLKRDEDGIPPVESVWQATLLYQILSSSGASGSPLAEFCLRDRELPDTSTRKCVYINGIQDTVAWHRAEWRLTVQPGAELLALDVVAVSGRLAVDHMKVAPISGFEEFEPSLDDIVGTGVRVARVEIDPLISVKSDQSAMDELEGAINAQLQSLRQEKADVSECRICMDQRGWELGCDQCTCGTSCTGWTLIGQGYFNGNPTREIMDDTSNKFGGCYRTYKLECRGAR